jgi:hypothetical protein
MSDSKIPIQTDSPDELAGGQKLARTDDPVYARNGNTVSQVFPLTGATGRAATWPLHLWPLRPAARKARVILCSNSRMARTASS